MKNIITAWITTNYTCNCKCDWCYARKMLGKHQNIDLQYAMKIVEYLKKTGVETITLIGGEPTIYPNLIDLISFIRSLGIKVRIATNGKRFKEKEYTKKILDIGIDGINISIKGLNEEEYFYYTHQYGFNDMIEGYNNLCKFGFDPSVSYVITDSNVEKFESFVHLLLTEKMDNLIIQFEKPSLSLTSNSTTMNIKEMGTFTAYIYSTLEETGINYTIEAAFPLCLIPEHTLNEMLIKKKISTCCHVQKGNGIVFDVTGEIIPCNHFLGFPIENEPLNLQNENAIEELMATDEYKKFKNVVHRYPTEKCTTCNLWRICGGGCFTRWFYLNPKDYI